jgi:hypothetical protein
MAHADLPPFFAPARRIYAERMKGAGPPLPEALLAVVAALRAGLGTGPMTYAGHPPRQIPLTPEALAEWLQDVHQRRRQGDPALFTLAAEPSPISGATLTFEMDPWPENGVEWVWYPLPNTPLPPVDAMLELVAAIARGFGAHRGVVEDDVLMVRYRGARAAERARSLVPPHLRQYVPGPLPAPRTADTLPELLVPQEFDRRRVPDAVWWINVWDAVQVATVGLERILRAPWARVARLPEGRLALAASESPPDPTNPGHLAQLARIVEALDLRALQEAHRLSA